VPVLKTAVMLGAAVVPSSPAAERMRRSRQRQRNGLRWLAIELRETEIDALIHIGFLQQELRDDSLAIGHALYSFLDQVGLDFVTRNG
jgi:hypothetical protein